MKPLRIRKEEAILVLIDFQERLMPAMKGNEELEKAVVKLVKGCRTLGVPVLVTQQYTKGLGPTIPSIHEALGEYEPIEKTAFSAMGEPVFVEKLKESKRKTVILAGIESHVCVLQTALDLVVASGAVGTTYESVLFELLGDAKSEGFKDISALVK